MNKTLMHLEALAEIDTKILDQYEKLIMLEIAAKKEHRPLNKEFADAIKEQKNNLSMENQIMNYFANNNFAIAEADYFLRQRDIEKFDLSSILAKNNHEDYIKARMIKAITYYCFFKNYASEEVLRILNITSYRLIKKFISEGTNVGSQTDVFLIESKYHLAYLTLAIETNLLDSNFAIVPNELVDNSVSEALTNNKSKDNIKITIKTTEDKEKLEVEIFPKILENVKELLSINGKDDYSKRKKLVQLYFIQSQISLMNEQELKWFKEYLKNYLTKINMNNIDTFLNELFNISTDFYPNRKDDETKKDTIF